jgi:hypothetical protein
MREADYWQEEYNSIELSELKASTALSTKRTTFKLNNSPAKLFFSQICKNHGSFGLLLILNKRIRRRLRQKAGRKIYFNRN